MKNPIVKVLLLFNVIVLGILCVRFLAKKNDAPKLPPVSIRYKTIQKFDPVSQDDFAKVNEIAHRMGQSSSLSDEDLRFMTRQLSQQYNGKTSAVGNLYVALVFKQFVPTAPQKQILLQELRPLLSTRTSSNALVSQSKSIACFALARGDVKEAVPQILPLLDDSAPQVRRAAQKALDALNVKKGG